MEPMKDQARNSEQRLRWMMMNAPVCLAETMENGEILQLNVEGESLFRPVMKANGLCEDNLFPVLGLIAPEVLEKIRQFREGKGVIVVNEMVSFSRKHLAITVSKLPDSTMLVAINDVTEKLEGEQAMLEKGIAQGRFELASDVLHDIGNAIVGLGSYLTRVRRSIDQSSTDNLTKLAGFFSAQQDAIAQALGETKAAAAVSMLNSIAETHKAQREEILRSIGEQTHIISHIQDILHIQRQYVNGRDTVEKKLVNLRSIINDCLSMQSASMEKRGILVTREIAEQVPSIMGDRTRLMQVILNLLKNSVEAIDITAGEKAVGIRLTTAEDMLTLQITDNGCGFDETTGAQLFDRGFTTKSSGTGLGLHNCRSIIESHAGCISITSNGPGKGSQTTITFKV